MIQGSLILNSRAEYNMFAIPRLITKLGEKEMKKWREEDKEMPAMKKK